MLKCSSVFAPIQSMVEIGVLFTSNVACRTILHCSAVHVSSGGHNGNDQSQHKLSYIQFLDPRYGKKVFRQIENVQPDLNNKIATCPK